MILLLNLWLFDDNLGIRLSLLKPFLLVHSLFHRLRDVNFPVLKATLDAIQLELLLHMLLSLLLGHSVRALLLDG